MLRAIPQKSKKHLAANLFSEFSIQKQAKKVGHKVGRASHPITLYRDKNKTIMKIKTNRTNT